MPDSRPAARIRRATLDDVDEITRLSDQLGYPVDPRTIGARLRSLLDHADCLVLVAQAGGDRLAGWAGAEKRQTLTFDTRVELAGLVVGRDARRCGVGRALLAGVERWAREQGIDTVFLRSNVIRPEAHAFYPSLGYAHAKTQHVYLKRLRDPAISPDGNESSRTR